MKNKPILNVAGEPNSIILEIFFNTIKFTKFKNPIILICSKRLLKLQMTKLKFKKKIKLITQSNLSLETLDNKFINLINVDFSQTSAFEKISNGFLCSKCSIIFLQRFDRDISSPADRIITSPDDSS